MRRRIRTEEYSIKTAGDQFTQCLLVNIAFEDGETIQVRTHATNQHMVAVKHQMLRSDGGSQPFISVTDIVGSIFGGDVLKNDFQRSQTLA